MIYYTVEEIRRIYEKINYNKLSDEDKLLFSIAKKAQKIRTVQRQFCLIVFFSSISLALCMLMFV